MSPHRTPAGGVSLQGAPPAFFSLFQVVWFVLVGGMGVMVLWTGRFTKGGPEGLGPEETVGGLPARLPGATLIASAALLFHSEIAALLTFLLAVAIAALIRGGRPQ